MFSQQESIEEQIHHVMPLPLRRKVLLSNVTLYWLLIYMQ